jgi:hypothetical protein
MFSLPHDPSLILGCIVDPDVRDRLLAVAKIQSLPEASERSLNEAIHALRSLEHTQRELMSFNIFKDSDGNDEGKDNVLVQAIVDARKGVVEAAETLADARLSVLKKLAEARGVIPPVSFNVATPVDYTKSVMKLLPVASDSLVLDAQYFNFTSNAQNSQNTLASINAFVSGSVEILGQKHAREASTAVQTQISQQIETHSIEGSLIITARCTHKNARMFAPFVIDPDRAVTAWNAYHTDDKINHKSYNAMDKVLNSTDNEKTLDLVEGAAYGSSFVVMIHVVRTTNTETSQQLASVASSLQTQMNVANWFANSSGGVGIGASFATDIKELLSTQDVQSHASIVAVGCIPTIKAGEVQLGVKTFSNFDPATTMGQLATMANSSSAQQSSVQNSAKQARTGGQMLAIRNSEIKTVMSSLAKLDGEKDGILDVSTAMCALSDFVQKAEAGESGVPIHFYVRQLSKADVARLWFKEYFPDRYNTIVDDRKLEEDESKSDPESL